MTGLPHNDNPAPALEDLIGRWEDRRLVGVWGAEDSRVRIPALPQEVTFRSVSFFCGRKGQLGSCLPGLCKPKHSTEALSTTWHSVSAHLCPRGGHPAALSHREAQPAAWHRRVPHLPALESVGTACASETRKPFLSPEHGTCRDTRHLSWGLNALSFQSFLEEVSCSQGLLGVDLDPQKPGIFHALKRMKTQAGRRPGLLKVRKKWLLPAVCGFFCLLSVVMTSCFLWQYHLPKLKTGSLGPEETSAPVMMCPRHPEPVPLAHPLPVLKEALEKVDGILRQAMSAPGLAAMSAVVIHNDTVLWTGNFGKKNGSDPASGTPNEYTMYRIASISKIFPVLMLYRLWEEGIVASLDDPLERYASTFTINNPLGAVSALEQPGLVDGLQEVGPAPRPSPVTLRRMASQLSGLPRRLRSTSLLWRGSTQEALNLLKDDVLVADPGTRCHYSTLAFSLLAHVLAAHTAQGDYQRWVSENVLEPLGMADTGFELTPAVRARLAAGFYGSGRPAPLYDLGWYRWASDGPQPACELLLTLEEGGLRTETRSKR
ncbi:putative beta-lactamase-like 1 [Carlito syrichta]|uniref:Beta-lactamase-like 1 n=1 Tax=Carlito syrichta TaxID=1868482 RepID=A0A3Q0EFI9_CARSF|nr:putative beta-lactamase-like 1 [Carlito syrichta]